MKKLLFIDHIFHRRTKSFDFIVKMLSNIFDVEHEYIDPAEPFDHEKFDTEAEYVVIAQVDFITPFFILMGKKVVVIQMYDGSFGLPDSHWILSRQARYINFSQTLHARAASLDCDSLCVKYSPDPIANISAKKFEKLKCFFWNRLPNSEINCEVVGRILKGQLDSCHVHLPRDDNQRGDESVKKFFDCPVTTSGWFENKAAFEAVLDSCNVFVAPRIAEGIGHAFLDAMARGMIVLAWDLPTHNEYISNWHNGILFNKNIGVISLKNRIDLHQISDNARKSLSNDHATWQLQKGKIADFILSCPSAAAPEFNKCRSDVLSIIRSYRYGLSSYDSELNKNKLTVDMMSKWRAYVSHDSSTTREIETFKTPNLNLLFGVGNAKYFQKRGFSDSEELFTWTDSQVSLLEIPGNILPFSDGLLRMKIKVRSVRQNRISIRVNDADVAEFKVSRNWQDLDFVLPIRNDGTIKIVRIEITARKLTKPENNDTRLLGVALERISIYASSAVSLPVKNGDFRKRFFTKFIRPIMRERV